jgi:hypothetical protein
LILNNTIENNFNFFQIINSTKRNWSNLKKKYNNFYCYNSFSQLIKNQNNALAINSYLLKFNTKQVGLFVDPLKIIKNFFNKSENQIKFLESYVKRFLNFKQNFKENIKKDKIIFETKK